MTYPLNNGIFDPHDFAYCTCSNCSGVIDGPFAEQFSLKVFLRFLQSVPEITFNI
jgi:hypothetical protein